MLKEKKSFFERLAGSISVEDEDDQIDFVEEHIDEPEEEEIPIKHPGTRQAATSKPLPAHSKPH
jgi:hypothetical protein